MLSLVKIPLSFLILVLVACGDGAKGGPGTPAPVPDQGNPPPAASGGVRGHYLTQATAATADTALAAMNERGQAGYAFVSDVVFTPTATVPAVRSLFVTNLTTPTTYHYAMTRGASDAATWLAAANDQGRQSRVYKGPVQYSVGSGVGDFRELFVGRADKVATFSYAAVGIGTSLADQTEASFLALLNGQGGQGRPFRGVLQLGSLPHALFVGDSSRPGPFSYRLLPAQSTRADFTAQLEAQAAAGFRFLGSLAVGGQGRALFQQETGDPLPVTVVVADSVLVRGEVAAVEALNVRASNGDFYLGDFVLTGTTAGADAAQVSVFSGGSQPAHPLSGPAWP